MLRLLLEGSKTNGSGLGVVLAVVVKDDAVARGFVAVVPGERKGESMVEFEDL